MKVMLLIVALMITSVFSQEVASKAEFELFGGLSIPLGDGADDMDNGINLGITGLGRINSNFAVGGSVDFNRWTEEIPEFDLKASLQYVGLIGLIRISTAEKNKTYSFLQFGAGIFMGTFTVEFFGESISDSQSDTGISISGGFVFDKFMILPSYKYVFTENDDGIKWFELSLGLNLR